MIHNVLTSGTKTDVAGIMDDITCTLEFEEEHLENDDAEALSEADSDEDAFTFAVPAPPDVLYDPPLAPVLEYTLPDRYQVRYRANSLSVRVINDVGSAEPVHLGSLYRMGKKIRCVCRRHSTAAIPCELWLPVRRIPDDSTQAEFCTSISQHTLSDIPSSRPIKGIQHPSRPNRVEARQRPGQGS